MQINKEHSSNIPHWMLEENDYPQLKKSVKTNFLTKTLKDFSMIIQNEVFSEIFVNKNGYLQMIEPRVKFLTLVLFMLFCAMTKSMLTLFLLAIIAVIFAKLSILNIKEYFKRVWLIVPLIVLIMSIPAATNLFVNGTPLFYIYKSSDNSLYFTSIGIQTILKMSLRIGVSISFAYLLIMTTRWTHITNAFSMLRIPPLIISILNMTYKYIFIITKIATEMTESRFLRTVGSSKNKANRGFIANRITLLFIKTTYLSDEIYEAMRCRGFTGEPVSLSSNKIGKLDVLWIINNAIIIIVLALGELLH